MNEDEIFQLAYDKAGNVCGADPAYFGQEGTLEVMNQIKILGYDCYLKEGFIKLIFKEGES